MKDVLNALVDVRMDDIPYVVEWHTPNDLCPGDTLHVVANLMKQRNVFSSINEPAPVRRLTKDFGLTSHPKDRVVNHINQ